MQHEFPQPPKERKNYLKADAFQDQEVILSYVAWEKKANEDDQPGTPAPRTWVQKLKYTLRYSWPEWAENEAHQKILDKKGEPFRNRNWDPKFPQGYSIIIFFVEGQLETGSKPLFEQFCFARPRPGDRISIKRTGKDKETKWYVKVVSRGAVPTHKPAAEGEMDFPSHELQPDDEIPF